jgi:hypothetical protein
MLYYNQLQNYFGISNEDKDAENNKDKPIYYTFKLPITYLESKYLHQLSPVVSSDLELTKCTNTNDNTESKSMYDIILKPKHIFAKQIINEWEKQYTNHIDFLKDTQNVLKDSDKYYNQIANNNYSLDCNKIMDVWKSVKEDNHFLEKYSYIEWNMLKYLNNSSSFLQCLSVINLMSPLVTLIIPIIFLILPFILLKIQRVPISFSIYISVLKDIAKHHFIGKTLLSMENFSVDKMGYLIITVLFYFLQIYQNINSFYKFYRNLNKINAQLNDMKEYINYSIETMELFVIMHCNKTTYSSFCKNTQMHISVLKDLQTELSSIQPSIFSISNINNLGYMLRCYYHLHTNKEYEKSIRYSIGFEGYINNLLGIYENMKNNYISISQFDTEKESTIKDQYYPTYWNEKHVKNNCKLDKNMIITGVNASGKTTILKTTTINIIFTQQFGCGFYKEFRINPYTHIHSYLNIPDTSGRDSLFQAESRRCKEIIDIIGNDKNNKVDRHFCIFDELYSGTNPIEATKAAYAFLAYLSTFKNVNFMLTTHYTSICKKVKTSTSMKNYKMNVEKLEDGKLKYTYQLKPGTCKIQGAIEILKNMDYPPEILNTIRNFNL